MDRVSFFKTLYQFCEGEIEIRPLPGEQGFFPIDGHKGIDSHCNNFAQSNLFFGVATRNGGGTKEHVVNIPAVWNDGDFKQTPREVLADKLKHFPFKPSIIVKSGGGVHLYWLLKEPAKYGDISIIEDINRRIAAALGGDTNSCDAARVLRVPDTLNYKYKPPRQCEVARIDNFYYDLSDFLEILPESNHKKTVVDNTEQKKPGWLQNDMAGVNEPGRNAAGARIAGYFINKLPAADVLTILQAWNLHNTPPLADKELQTIVKSVSRYQLEIATKSKVDISNVFDAARMVEAYQEHIANLKKNRFILGISEIDKRIRGVAGGEVLTILARSGSFKTAMLQNLLKNYVQNSAWAAVFFSIEMPVASVTERYFQILDGCTGREVESLFTDVTQSELKNKAVGQFVKDLKGFYSIPTRVSLSDIGAYVRLIETEKNVKVGVIGIDYLGLMDGPGANTYETISRLATGTKNIAKLLNIPVILLSQVSRKGGSGQSEISLDMGRDSGAIEEGADFVLGLWQKPRDEKDVDVWAEGLPAEKPQIDLICKILKNRKGSAGSTWKLELVAHAMQIGANAVPYEPKKSKKAKLSV
jgi:replicative DNA helicase